MIEKKLTAEQEKVCAEVVKEYEELLDSPDPVYRGDGAQGGLSLAAISAFAETVSALKDSERIARTLAWLGEVSQSPGEATEATLRAWLEVVYKGESQAVPPITIVDSPRAAVALANLLVTGPKVTSLDHSGLADAGWVSYSDAMLRIMEQTEEEAAPSMKLKAYLRMIFDSVLLGFGPNSKEGRAILVRHAKCYRRDSGGQLHCKDGPSIEWYDGQRVYFWHSVQVPEKLIMAPESYTADDYRAITSTEVRRAFGERYGWNQVVELIGSTLVNEWTDTATGLAYGLFRTESGAGGRREQWLRKQSPVLMTTQQPIYFEPVHEDLRTAQAARKWQAVPEMRPEDCERDPVLTYGIET